MGRESEEQVEGLRTDAGPRKPPHEQEVHRAGARAVQSGDQRHAGREVSPAGEEVAQKAVSREAPVVGSLQLGIQNRTEQKVSKKSRKNTLKAKEKKVAYWASVVCEGCSRRCRYRDFRVFTKNGFKETLEGLWKITDDSSKWVYKRRGTVLGIMHECKKEAWDYFISNCPHYGEDDAQS